MPPRYAYWTILIDNKATAFRAREADELLPTFNQLKRKNADVAMKWFARGRLWDSPEAERTAQRQPKIVERRGGGWRPGGKHEDPRARFAKKKKRDGDWDAPRDATAGRERKPWDDKPVGAPPRRAPRQARPWSKEPPGSAPRGAPRGAPQGNRPWDKKPATGAPDTKRPWGNRPAPAPGAKRPWQDKPGPTGGRRPWSDKPQGGAPRGDRPWNSKRRAAGPQKGSEPAPGDRPETDKATPKPKPPERR